jgi:hypothetical protein
MVKKAVCMRNGRLALILFVILLISIAGYNAAKALRTADSKTIYKLESGSIDAIQITAKDTGVSFAKNDVGWVMIEPAGYKTDKGTVEGLEKLFENLSAVRSIEKNPKDLNKYGLIDPVMTARIKLKDGREKTLLIGGVAASKYQYYVKDSEVNTVYTMSAADVETLGDGDPYSFRDRELLAVEKGKISLLSLDLSGKREMSLRQYDAGKWEFIEPVRTSAKNDALNEIIKGIAGLKIKDFVEDAPDGLYRFGLDKPAFSLEIGDQNGKIQRIDFGKRDQEKEEVYICSDHEKGVFTVSTQDFDPYDIKLGDLLNETP